VVGHGRLGPYDYGCGCDEEPFGAFSYGDDSAIADSATPSAIYFRDELLAVETPVCSMKEAPTIRHEPVDDGRS